MLKLTIIGNLGSDSEIKKFGSINYATFSVAHKDSYIDKNGVKVDNVQWVSCLKRLGEKTEIVNFLKKGTKVYIEGGLSAKTYKDCSGDVRLAINCNVTHIELLGSKQVEQSGNPVVTSKSYSTFDKEKTGIEYLNEDNNGEDDLPF